jgi:integrase/recombinase XerC
VTWTFDVDRPRSEPYRDTSGPGLAVAGRMAGVLAGRGDTPAARRDRAIFYLAATAGLRRGEIVGLEIGDVDLDGNRVRLRGKGRREKTWLVVGAAAGDALGAWLAVRDTGELAAPVFVGITRAGRQRQGALSSDAVYKLIRSLGAEAGASVPVRPHGLRHTAITTVAERSGVIAAQQLSRHRKLDTLQLYLDNTDRTVAPVDTMASALDEAAGTGAGAGGERTTASGDG